MTGPATGEAGDSSKCGAKTKARNGAGSCARPAGWGTEHVGTGRCKLHGGNTPNHNLMAQRVLAEKAVQTYGIRRDMPPALALLEEFGWSRGHVIWLRGIVQQLEPEALVWGKSEEHEKTASEFPGVDVKYLAAPSVWLKLYHDERKMLLDLGKTIETLKLEARKADVLKKYAGQFHSMIDGVARVLGHDPTNPAVAELIQGEIARQAGFDLRMIEGNVA